MDINEHNIQNITPKPSLKKLIVNVKILVMVNIKVHLSFVTP